jgi:uncharacterized protein (DUF488 family)
MSKIIWTVGHSTRTIDEFIGLLRSYEIEAVVDVRTVPRSRKNPQFNKDSLEQTLVVKDGKAMYHGSQSLSETII